MTNGNGNGNGTGKKLQLIHDASTIYYLHPSEGPSNSLTKYLLTGDNYDIWTRAIVNALGGRNKFGFVNGVFVKPVDEKSPEFAAWKSNNSIICSWIFNSVDISIQPSIASHSIASELWIDLKERYSTANGPRINQLKSEYHNFRQKELSVVLYYNKFKSLWDELYGSVDVTCGCTCSAATKLRARAAEAQVHDFVLGLNDDKYNTLRTQILSMDPFPTINKAFSLATQEERHKSIVRDRDDKTEAMSFAIQNTASTSTVAPSSSAPVSSITGCGYCGKPGHDYERCYQRVGYPSRGRGRGRSSRGRGYASSGRGQQSSATANAIQGTQNDAPPASSSSQTATAVPGFTSEQVQQLLTLIDNSSSKLSGPQFEDADWTR